MVSSAQRPSPLVLGLALFSMFFGSGNLIFPLFLGQLAQQDWSIAFVGFLLTAVSLPLLGVMAMVVYAGQYRTFFAQLGRIPGLLLTIALLTVWIPLGSAPRCISLSYASLTTYFAVGPLWLYAVLYSSLALVIIKQKTGMLTILGSYLTPLLLLCLLAIVAFGINMAPTTAIDAMSSHHEGLFFSGLVEGYNTMDLIASFFFSASIIGLLPHSQSELKSTLKLVLQAGAIAAFILAIVYVSLLYTAATHHTLLVGVPKEQMLAQLAKMLLGENLGIVAAIAITLACFTTSIALVAVFGEFLRDTIGGGNDSYYTPALVLTSVVSIGMAMTGLEGITAVTSPVLQIGYPLLLILIVSSLSYHAYVYLRAPKAAAAA